MVDELLQQILGELQGIKSGQQALAKEVNQHSDELKEIKSGQQALAKEMNQRFDELKNSVDRKHLESIKSDELILQSLKGLESSMYRIERIELRQNRTTVKVDELEADVSLLRDKLKN